MVSEVRSHRAPVGFRLRAPRSPGWVQCGQQEGSVDAPTDDPLELRQFLRSCCLEKGRFESSGHLPTELRDDQLPEQMATACQSLLQTFRQTAPWPRLTSCRSQSMTACRLTFIAVPFPHPSLPGSEAIRRPNPVPSGFAAGIPTSASTTCRPSSPSSRPCRSGSRSKHHERQTGSPPCSSRR